MTIKSRSRRWDFAFGLVALAAVVAAASGEARAQTWQGGSSTWSNAANWSGPAPVSGGTSALFFSLVGGTAQNDFQNTFNATTITFSSGTTWLTGNAIRLATASGTSIFNLVTAGTQTIGMNIDLSGTARSQFRFLTGTSGTIAGGAGFRSTTILSGNISGTGGLAFYRAGSSGIGLSQTPVLVLSGSNSYSGNTYSYESRLVLASPAALATSGTLMFEGSSGVQPALDVSSWATGTIANNTWWSSGGGWSTIVTPTSTKALWLTGTTSPYRGGLGVGAGETLYIRTLALGGTDSYWVSAQFGWRDPGTLVIYEAAQPSYNVKRVPLWVQSGTAVIGHQDAIGTNTSGTIQAGAGEFQTTLSNWNIGFNVAIATNQSTTFGGTGNITITGPITAGIGSQNFSKSGPMTLTLSGTNSYANVTRVLEGDLVLSSSWALPGGIDAVAMTGSASLLRIGSTGVGAGGSGVVGIRSGTLSRTLGTGSTQIDLTSGGFAGYAANQVVNLGGASAVATWGYAGFNGVASGTFMSTMTGTFILGSTGATHAIDFQNPLNFSGTARNIRAEGPGGILSGVLSNGGLTKLGLGTLSLAADNLYTGTTTISGGTLQVGVGGAAGSLAVGSPVSVSSTATLAFNRSDALIYGGTVSGAGGLEKRGAGTLVLTASSGYSGATTIAGGTLQIGNGSTTGGINPGSAVSVSAGAVLAFNRSDALVYGGTVSGAGGLEKRGAGTTTLTGSHSYLGATVVTAGTLSMGNGGTSGWIPAASPVSIASGAAFAFNRSDSLVFGGTFTGAGSLVKQGSGALTLTGSNGFSGGTTISAGSIVAQSPNALGTGAVNLAASSAALKLEVGAIISNAILGSGTIQFAGGGLERTSNQALATVADLVAGTGASPVALNPGFAWSARIVDKTISDVLDLTQTAGTVQILQLTYDPSLIVVGQTDANAYLGWLSGGAWVNSVVGNSTTGGLALVNQTGGWQALGVAPTADYLGSWGRDTTNKTVWAVVDHNSEYAAIVPEPGSLALAGIGVGIAGWAAARRRRRG